MTSISTQTQNHECRICHKIFGTSMLMNMKIDMCSLCWSASGIKIKYLFDFEPINPGECVICRKKSLKPHELQRDLGNICDSGFYESFIYDKLMNLKYNNKVYTLKLS